MLSVISELVQLFEELAFLLLSLDLCLFVFLSFVVMDVGGTCVEMVVMIVLMMVMRWMMLVMVYDRVKRVLMGRLGVSDKLSFQIAHVR